MLEATIKNQAVTSGKLLEIAETFKSQTSLYPLDEIIELASIWATDLLGRAELIAAQDEFFANTGKIFHDDTFYDSRISYFIEHFLFERPISGLERASNFKGMIPYQLFINHAIEGLKIDLSTKAIFASLIHARHSLYEVEKITLRGLIVRDILIPQKIKINAKKTEHYVGFDNGTIFQGFVFRLPEACHLGSGLIIHPNRAKTPISSLLKQSRKTGPTPEFPFLCKLAKTHLRHIRHQHVDIKTIYSKAM